ncbi:MAG TPA: AAA family ATPase [Candidatus Nitrosotenuis sp.]|jgi:predicted ATPase|nr:AAA family ATPase [Candidatus Nitrosotenuis sp.]
MKHYILTGTPGSGKTSLIRDLEMRGYPVVEEAATDVIAHEQSLGYFEPWKQPEFIDKIVHLQKQRQLQALYVPSLIRFYDRSPICTYALSVYLRYKPSINLLREIERTRKLYERRVFFIENLGFCQPTEARKISFEESLIFENIHLEAYEKFGYDCIKIPLSSIAERVDSILRLTI